MRPIRSLRKDYWINELIYMIVDTSYNRLMILANLKSVDRKGISQLIAWLDNEITCDYFSAPASTKFHLSVVGGLAQHHLNVFRFFKAANREFNLGLSRDSVIIVSLLHDLCKCHLYLRTGNTYKCSNKIKEQGHAKASIEIIKNFINLSEEEEAIIRYHMGTFGIFDYGNHHQGEYNDIDIHKAIKKYASVQIFAACDMGSSRFEKCFRK